MMGCLHVDVLRVRRNLQEDEIAIGLPL